MANLLTDFSFALRGLVRRPGFTVVVLATLTLGIGATTAIFSVVDALLLRPLPFADPEELVMVWERNFPRNRERNTVAAVNFRAWREKSVSFEDMAAFVPWGVTLQGDGRPERLQAAAVTPGFFSILRVEPILGRRFVPEEGETGKDSVVILTHAFWQRHFAGDAGVVGRTLHLNGTEHEVLGVLPRGFGLPKIDPRFGAVEKAELFAPLTLATEYSGRSLQVLGRLQSGTSLQQAQTEMTALAQRLEKEQDYNQGWGVNLVPLHHQVVGHLETALFVLLGAVALVLLIACGNVANLLLARATGRRREIAVRTTLGASRPRLLAQLLIESLVLALIGGGLGLLWAIWGLELLLALAPEGLPRLHEVGVDPRTLAFTAGAALLAALVFGLAPAVQASRPDLSGALKEGERGAAGAGGHRLRHGLVVVEVALALLLLVGSGLLIRSFAHLLEVDTGFEPRNVASLKITLPRDAYSESHEITNFYRELLLRLESLAGVLAAGATMTQPFDGFGIGTSFLVEGQADPGVRERPVTDVRPVTPGYFETLGIPLREGRDFDARDTADAPLTAVVSRTLADRFWPDGEALGKQVIVNLNGLTPYEIVGVADDIKHMGLDTTPREMVYIAHAQFPVRGMVVLMRAARTSEGLAAAARKVIAEIDPALPVHSATTLEERVSASVAEERFQMTLLALFAALALALAAVGLYGLLSYSVSQRTHEIGVRLALGAGRSRVLGLVIRQAFTLIVIGLALGLAGAIALRRFIASLLFEVTSTDPLTYATVALVLLGAGILASYLPARRAAEVDPIVALRHE